jgi:putative transposase
MRELDALFMDYPTWGSRKLVQFFALAHRVVNRKRIQRLRRAMGLETIYRTPRTSLPGNQPQRFPYLLRNKVITLPNEVWCADITYIPMSRGSFYLVAIMDWASRKVLSWRLSNTLDTAFCLAALHDALSASTARPGIFNTDQGCQFTCAAWVSVLKEKSILISQDGKGRWMDNVFIERLWRSLKYDEIYIKCFSTGEALSEAIEAWFEVYNSIRPHQALGGLTPAMVYSGVSR